MKVTTMAQSMSRCFRLPACWLFMFATTAYCGAAPTEKERTIKISRKDPKFAGYELGDLPLNALVKLKLTVKDDDAEADFVRGSGAISSTRGRTAWTIMKNEEHLYEAESARAQFRRDHKLYVAYARGRWAVAGAGGAGAPPIWEVDVFQVLIDAMAGRFPKHNKLLATAGYPLTATLHVLTGRARPSGTVAWSHPLGGMWSVQALKTTFTAPTALTPDTQEDKQHVKVTFTPKDGTPSSDSHPLNITAPKLFRATWPDRIISTVKTGWFNSNKPGKTKVLLKSIVEYKFFDQFGDSIGKDGSDRGESPRKDIQAKEDVPWDGLRDDANAWGRSVKTTTDWINNNKGIVRDELDLFNFPTQTLIDPATKPGPNPKFNFTKNQEVLFVRHHVQRATVSRNETLNTPYTENVISFTILDYRDMGHFDRIRLKVTYEVKVTKRP